MMQTVQIIGGLYRGKKIHFPLVPGLRPTPSRVRETVFNWLMHDIRGAACLDAFAGSGMLGFEALSRGASQVTLLEKNPFAYAVLRKSASSFNSPCLTVKKMDACDFLKSSRMRFDIIFLDPPFADNYLPQCLMLLVSFGLLKTGGWLYMESSGDVVIDATYWDNIKLKKSGQVTYGLWRFKGSSVRN